jgi:outer membrane receptor for ferrienterochelin and colicin
VGATEYNDYLNGTLSYGPGRYGIEVPGAPNGSSPGQTFYIGKRWDLTDTVNAKIAVCNIYDRALTNAEVLQNYNYYRSRFGL